MNESVVLGFDIGGTVLRQVAMSNSDTHPPPEFFGHRKSYHERVASDIVERITEAVAEHDRASTQPASSVGVACTGLVSENGIVVSSFHIPTLNHYPLRRVLEKKLGRPVHVENDAAAAAWAEVRVGAGAGTKNMVYAAFGTGIGGAVVIDGKIVRGAHGLGSEVGDITIDLDGPVCKCGKVGCWEVYASGNSLANFAQKEIAEGQQSMVLELAGDEIANIEGTHVTEAMLHGDGYAKNLLNRFAGWTAMGLSTAIAWVDPEVVVLSGGVSTLGEHFVGAVGDAYRKQYDQHHIRHSLVFRLAECGDSAGCVGAALLAADIKNWGQTCQTSG